MRLWTGKGPAAFLLLRRSCCCCCCGGCGGRAANCGYECGCGWLEGKSKARGGAGGPACCMLEPPVVVLDRGELGLFDDIEGGGGAAISCPVVPSSGLCLELAFLLGPLVEPFGGPRFFGWPYSQCSPVRTQVMQGSCPSHCGRGEEERSVSVWIPRDVSTLGVSLAHLDTLESAALARLLNSLSLLARLIEGIVASSRMIRR